MRSLKPISVSPMGNRLKNVSLLEPIAAAFPPAYRPGRKGSAQLNSWLSSADANLLLRKQTRMAIAQKNYTHAIALLNQLIAYAPESAEHYSNRGLMHYCLAQIAQALADYNQALSLDPELDKAYSNRANLHATQQNWTAALADYDCALDFNPLNIRARINQAITFREMGEYEEALVCLDIAMFFTPASATLYAERGRTYHLQGEWNCAIAEYNKSLSLIRGAQQDLTQNTVLMDRVLKWMTSFQ
jgi:tetratricopeptide (TPR) repeat protein